MYKCRLPTFKYPLNIFVHHVEKYNAKIVAFQYLCSNWTSSNRSITSSLKARVRKAGKYFRSIKMDAAASTLNPSNLICEHNTLAKNLWEWSMFAWETQWCFCALLIWITCKGLSRNVLFMLCAVYEHYRTDYVETKNSMYTAVHTNTNACMCSQAHTEPPNIQLCSTELHTSLLHSKLSHPLPLPILPHSLLDHSHRYQHCTKWYKI